MILLLPQYLTSFFISKIYFIHHLVLILSSSLLSSPPVPLDSLYFRILVWSRKDVFGPLPNGLCSAVQCDIPINLYGNVFYTFSFSSFFSFVFSSSSSSSSSFSISFSFLIVLGITHKNRMRKMLDGDIQPQSTMVSISQR